MPEIFFPSRNISAQELSIEAEVQQYLKRNNALSCNGLNAHMPYCLNTEAMYPEAKIITQTLGALTPRARHNLMCGIDQFGDSLKTVANFYSHELSTISLPPLDASAGITASGAAVTSLSHRMTAFQLALIKHQDAVRKLHNLKGSGRFTGARRVQLRQEVGQTRKKLQSQFSLEMKKFEQASRSQHNPKGYPTSSKKIISLAEKPTFSRRLDIATNQEAINLQKLVKASKVLGPGLIAVDAGMRINTVHDIYKQGGEWEKELTKQTSGLVAGAAVGLGVGSIVGASLTGIALLSNPVGWVIIIGVGVGAGTASSIFVDNKTQNFVGELWEKFK